MSNKGHERSFLASSSSSSSNSSISSDEDLPRQTDIKPRILYTPNGDQILELTIETLMGTTFEVRLPAKTSVASIKNRLQRSEGVPKHHLHIIHSGTELPDDLSLRKCGVQNGDRLKLVLGMRGGPINMRRVALPSTQPKHNDLQHLMLKNKDQILEKMPKNGQVTVLLFREGDKVNVYHVLEKPDGSFSPISNDQSPSSSPEHQIHEDIAQSNARLKRLLDSENQAENEENPFIKQRLKENAATMNKMSELRTQLENLSMLKKSKQRKTAKKHQRPKSGRRSNMTQSRQSKWSASTTQSSMVKGQNSIPLPPINAPNNSDATMFHEDQLDQEPFGDDYCTIHPLNERPSRTSNSRGLPTLKEKGHKNKVPEWLGRNDNPYNHHKTIASRLEPKSRSRSRPHLQHMSHKQESDDEKSNVSAVMKHSKPPPNIDLVDLQYRPENSSLEIVNHRKTQKLISTDLSNVVTQDAQVKHGTLQSTLQKSVKGTKNRGSPSNTRLNLSSSDSSPRSKTLELRKKWLKPTEGETLFSDFKHDSTQPVLEAYEDGNKQKKLLPLRSSGTRSSKSNSSATARNSANENKRTSRPKFVANTLTAANKKKSTKTRCGVCNKKVNITNTFGCRCSKIFCPKHRHPELHGCTFDYRTEGRKQLEEANPVVILPKLPKI